MDISVTAPMGTYKQSYTRYDTDKSRYVGNQLKWQSANIGYYLDDARIYYYGIDYLAVTKCTNAPDKSHYTSAGSPQGNDCSWVCDEGYMQDGATCTTCPAGYQCVNGVLVCPPGQYASGMTCVDCPAFYQDRAPDNTAPQSVDQCQIKCDGGMYLASANDTSCSQVSAGYWNNINYTNYGSVGTRNKCPDGLTTIGWGPGADSESDCGKILHIGDYKLYLHSVKLTSPSLAIQYGDHVLYADMKRETHGHLRAEYNGYTYSIYNADIE